MITPPAAVFFDLDGTLIDSRGDIAAACNHALVSEGRSPLPVDVVRGFVGDGARWLLARAFGLTPEDPAVTRALDVFRAYYEAHPTDHTLVLPGLDELVARLGGVPLAVVTNKPRSTAEIVLERLGLRSLFREVRGGGDGPLKPDPTVTRALIRRLAVPAGDVWFVGDGAQDIDAGRAAGCFTIAVGGMGDCEALARAQPHLFVKSLSDLAARVGAQPGP